MTPLAQSDREALYVAVEGILLDLRHRWQPDSWKIIARYRKRDKHGRPTEEASAWLLDAARAVVSDLKPDTLADFPSDPVDHACLVAAQVLLALDGGLPADNPAAHSLATALRELEAIARRHERAENAASGGRSRSSAIRPAPRARLPQAQAPEPGAPKPEPAAPDTTNPDPEPEPVRVRAAIDEAIRLMPGSSTAALVRTLRPKIKAMGVPLSYDALRKRIERRR